MDRHNWKSGFACGYVCAAANVVRTHDQPTIALDLLKEGIGREDISAVDESDIETLVNSDSRIADYLRRDISTVAEAVFPCVSATECGMDHCAAGPNKKCDHYKAVRP